MTPPHAHIRMATETEADAWADVLVRYGLLHAAIRTPNGQWLIQRNPHGTTRVLDGPSAMLGLAAHIQYRTRQEARSR